jgi:hypothetical protein
LPDLLKEAFDVVDVDIDSNVSTAEYEAARVYLLEGIDFAALDTDDDGVIGIEGTEELPLLSAAYDRVDTDMDTLIGQAEFIAAQRK